MEEPGGPEASIENGASSPRSRHAPHNNNNSSGWLNMKGPLSPFNGRAAAGPAHKLSYLGRVVREIVETERMYVQDLRSIVEVRLAPMGWVQLVFSSNALGSGLAGWQRLSMPGRRVSLPVASWQLPKRLEASSRAPLSSHLSTGTRETSLWPGLSYKALVSEVEH